MHKHPPDVFIRPILPKIGSKKRVSGHAFLGQATAFHFPEVELTHQKMRSDCHLQTENCQASRKCLGGPDSFA